MKTIFNLGLVLTLLSASGLAADPKATSTTSAEKSTSTETFKACQTRSPNTGSFFDLNPIHVLPPDPPEADDSKRAALQQDSHRRRIRGQALGPLARRDVPLEDDGPKSWHARGHDYQSNFTINFCGPVVEDIKNVVGVPPKLWQNVSAYYTYDGRVFSLGQQNSNLTWRGRKLTVNYTQGSPCPRAGSDWDKQHEKENWSKRHKSTLISLLCERDPLAPKAALAFVGTNDECTYFFEARSSAACPTAQVDKQQVGPSGLFGVIFGVAFLVYVIGGVVYQRAVMHQRGWRQLPNYALWHGIVSFVQDSVVILFSSCARCSGLQRKNNRGFSRATNGNASRGDLDENRLIDELSKKQDDP